MTTKQTKEFNAATAELDDVRTKMASAQSDIEAEEKKVDAARAVADEAKAALEAAESQRIKAIEKLQELKPYEDLALKKTRKVIAEAIPGVVQTTVENVLHVKAQRVDIHNVINTY